MRRRDRDPAARLQHPGELRNTGFELWEVVHRAKWQRFHFGHALYRKGEEGNSFHIMAQGEVEVFRDGKKVAQLGAGTSVGEMAYLAPSAELKKHSTDVIVTEPATTISFTPETLLQLEPEHAATCSTTPSSRCSCGGCTRRTRRWRIRAASSSGATRRASPRLRRLRRLAARAAACAPIRARRRASRGFEPSSGDRS